MSIRFITGRMQIYQHIFNCVLTQYSRNCENIDVAEQLDGFFLSVIKCKIMHRFNEIDDKIQISFCTTIKISLKIFNNAR